jgi:hypothetical protein
MGITAFSDCVIPSSISDPVHILWTLSLVEIFSFWLFPNFSGWSSFLQDFLLEPPPRTHLTISHHFLLCRASVIPSFVSSGFHGNVFVPILTVELHSLQSTAVTFIDLHAFQWKSFFRHNKPWTIESSDHNRIFSKQRPLDYMCRMRLQFNFWTKSSQIVSHKWG